MCHGRCSDATCRLRVLPTGQEMLVLCALPIVSRLNVCLLMVYPFLGLEKSDGRLADIIQHRERYKETKKSKYSATHCVCVGVTANGNAFLERPAFSHARISLVQRCLCAFFHGRARTNSKNCYCKFQLIKWLCMTALQTFSLLVLHA